MNVWGVFIATPSTITYPSPDGLEVMVTLGAKVLKWAVMLPGPVMVAEVEVSAALTKVIPVVSLVHPAKV